MINLKKLIKKIFPTSPPVVGIHERVLLDVLNLAQKSHPYEIVVILKSQSSLDSSEGKIVDGFYLPPDSSESNNQASFSVSSLPVSMDAVGVAHSHPNGVLEPSLTDVNSGFSFGSTHLIVGYPYDRSSWKFFDSEGDAKDIRIL
jgi:proteasome lid subunit RPN8/RPN11